MKTLRGNSNANASMANSWIATDCNLFDDNTYEAPGPINSIIHPVNGRNNGLPTLDEFCTLPRDAIPNDAVDAVFDMLRHDEDRQFLTNLLSSTENDLPPVSLTSISDATVQGQSSEPNASIQPIENQSYPTYCELMPARVSSSLSPSDMSISFDSVDSANLNNTSSSLGQTSTVLASDTLSMSAISSEHLMPTPTSNVEEQSGAKDSLDKDSDTALNEVEIDTAMLTVLSVFERCSDKETTAILDAATLQRCLENVRKSPLLMCPTCLDVFQDISPFQVHLQICIGAPRVQLRQKMDQEAIEKLACDLWKEAFLKKLNELPNSQKFMQREDFLRTELDQLWKTCHDNDAMARCRPMFIRITVLMITRKWTETALANEIVRVNKLTTVKPKKRPINEINLSETGTSDAKRYKTVTAHKKPAGRKRTIRSSTKNAPKTTETDRAVEALVADQAEIFSSETPDLEFQHAMPDTPVSMSTSELMTPRSDRGAEDFPIITIGLNPFDRAGSTTSNTGKRMLPDTQGKEQTHKGDKNTQYVPDYKRYKPSTFTVGENRQENSNYDSDCLIVEPSTIKSEDSEEVESDDQYLVDKILNRRKVIKVLGGIPRDDHYEYLVSWVGCSAEENSWEPYKNLDCCKQKLQEFHERLLGKASRV